MVANPFDKTYFMKQALKEAYKALELDEVPVGCVIVCENQIIARAHNFSYQLNDATAHAEMQAFTSATNFLGSRYLDNCTLYVTLEPCAMCAGASYWAQLKRIVYGAKDEKRGYFSVSKKILHPKTEVIGGVMAQQCSKLLKEFFKRKR